jgi:putative glutamine amidotransferase
MKYKRLASCLYQGIYPFDKFKIFQGLETVVVRTPEDLKPDDVLIVWGGEDISPSLYGKKAGDHTHATDIPSSRDSREWAMMKHAKTMGVPIIGVCRGAQMLTALEGGYLIQHVNNHGGRHTVETVDHVLFETNSIHHQMMVPPKDKAKYELVAWMPEPISTVYYDVDDAVEVDVEPEFIYYPGCKGFAVQWHPEGMSLHSPANLYLDNFMKDKLC